MTQPLSLPGEGGFVTPCGISHLWVVENGHTFVQVSGLGGQGGLIRLGAGLFLFLVSHDEDALPLLPSGGVGKGPDHLVWGRAGEGEHHSAAQATLQQYHCSHTHTSLCWAGEHRGQHAALHRGWGAGGAGLLPAAGLNGTAGGQGGGRHGDGVLQGQSGLHLNLLEEYVLDGQQQGQGQTDHLLDVHGYHPGGEEP